jgi:6-phosphogluconolactonase
MTISVEVRPDAEAAGTYAGDLVAERIREATAAGRRFAWAISGGTSPAPMFRRLGELDLPWASIDTWQVDERVAPLGDPDRNRTIAEVELPPEALGGVRWMPVEDADLEHAAAGYAETLPARFDVVHLGLGPDGHTASLVPGDPVLEERERTVAVTEPYQGRRRMTFTFPALERAAWIVWLVDGAEKREALTKLIARDPSIPGSGVAVPDQLIVTDVDVATP